MHHAFVTEYAGTSSVMQNAVWSPGRYGDPNLLLYKSNIKYMYKDE